MNSQTVGSSSSSTSSPRDDDFGKPPGYKNVRASEPRQTIPPIQWTENEKLAQSEKKKINDELKEKNNYQKLEKGLCLHHRMDSKSRRKHAKAQITAGSEELVVNERIFLIHRGHYENYEFTVTERDKFWSLRVLLALNYTIWTLADSSIYTLLPNPLLDYESKWRVAKELFDRHVASDPPGLLPFIAFRGLIAILQRKKLPNRLRQAGDFAWNIGLEAVKVDPPTDGSLLRASIGQSLSAVLYNAAKSICLE